MIQRNPTLKKVKRIIEVVQKNKKPISLTAISKVSNSGFYEVRSAVEFLKQHQIVNTTESSGRTTLVCMGEKQNE